jgi:hypothetical protein
MGGLNRVAISPARRTARVDAGVLSGEVESQDRSRISNRVVNFAGRDRTKGVEATLKACHDAKIGAGAPEGPQQIWVVLRINRQNSAVRGKHTSGK